MLGGGGGNNFFVNSCVYETRRSGRPEAPVSRKENMNFLSAAAPLDLLFKGYICWGFFFPTNFLCSLMPGSFLLARTGSRGRVTEDSKPGPPPRPDEQEDG